LSEKGVKIWKENADEFHAKQLNKGNSEHIDGDLGSFYSHNWRHFGAKYINCKTDYTGKGVDQLKNVIDQIKNNFTSRRIIISAWDPASLENAALPPCHVLYQFYVNNKKELSCMVYQRSADLMLGIPWNIASASLLTHMIAKVCGLTAKSLVHCIGDAHIYLNHIEGAKLQIKRAPVKFPTVSIKEHKDIEDFSYEDFKLNNYTPQDAIKLKMAV
jgi:thymidylate synthase